MLTSLYIKNYALIEALDVKFSDGFTIITGQTGAGKSILLGGLSLVLGKRADLSQVKHQDQKCVIEAAFDVVNYNLKSVFDSLDLDYDAHTIIRREILPSGKSRAFINDTPVTLDALSALSAYLIDVHSQHQTLQLTEDEYQLKVIDALANNANNLETYATTLAGYKQTQKTLNTLKNSKDELLKEYDYNLFLYQELDAAKLDQLDLEALENEYDTLSNAETIAEKLNTAANLLHTEDVGIIDQITTIKQELSKIASFSNNYQSIFERIESVNIELQDVLTDLDTLQEQLQSNPKHLEVLSAKLTLINNLFQKHAVNTIADLIVIQNNLQNKVNDTQSLDQDITAHEEALTKQQNTLNQLAQDIHKNRAAIIPQFTKKLEHILAQLGMPNAKFNIALNALEEFLPNGKDHLEFLFMANKGSHFNALKKAASGGELSRIMLAIKSILADYVQLPTLIFDEIDTGVSGEISNKMATIMKQMSQRMQVFSITHLPQIAAKGNTHFKVYKKDIDNQTTTRLKRLNQEERIEEIAQMLGGQNITQSAIAHAKALLN